MGRSANDLILSTQFLFSPFWGSVSDRIGRRPVLMIGLVGNTVFFTMFGLANTLFIALAARFMAGYSMETLLLPERILVMLHTKST